MKTKLSFLFFLQIISFQLFAQDIDVKKGIVTVDKNNVFKIEEADKKTYKISNLEGSVSFFVSQSYQMIRTVNGDENFNILTLSPTLNGEKYLISFDTKDIKLSFSLEKYLARIIYLKTGLFTNNTLSEEKVTAFFKTPRPEIEEIKQAEAAYKLIHDKFLTENYTIDGKKILKDGKEIGSYNVSTEKVGTYNYITYYIRDVNKNQLLQYQKGYQKGNLFDGQEFKFSFETNRNEVDEILLLLEKYLSFGYNVTDDIANQNNEKIQARIDNFKGINFSKGYVIDENNIKIEGLLYIEWESQQQGSIADLDKPGSILKVRHTNDKGKDRIDMFKASKNLTFCLENGNCYKGFKSHIISPAVYYKEIYKGEKVSLYKNGNPEEKGMYLCKPNETQGISLIDSEKLQSKLTEYFKDCPNFSITSYDLNNEESIMKMVVDYNKCVK